MEANYLPPQSYPSCMVPTDHHAASYLHAICPNQAKHGQMELGQVEELVILFLDIRNFTTLMEKHNVYDMIYILKNLLHRFNGFIREFGGEVIETAGDSIYAVFGRKKQVTLKKAAHQALDTSYAIIDNLETFNVHFAEPFLNIHFELGIGIHNGQVIVGQSLIHQQNGISVMGLAVNIASRLQEATKELNNNLLMSEETYQLLENDNSKTLSKALKLKGIQSPIEVRLLGKSFGADLSISSSPTDKEDNMSYYLAYAG